VGDFGIALPADAPAGSVPAAGTPLFMAPELWTGAAVDRRADVYGLGAAAHLLAMGAPPFPAGDLAAVRAAHLTAPYAPPAPASPRSAYFFAAVERMLAKTPDGRYPDAEAVVRTLSVIAEPMPALRPDSPDHARAGELKVRLVVGDLAATRADVLVNAANTELDMRQGVAEALSRTAGPSVERAATAQGPGTMGEVIWTEAGGLDARWVAHAIAAIEGAVCLQRCALRVLLGAEARGARVVAFPALGTGVGGGPMDLAAKLLLEATRTFASLSPQAVREVRWVLFDEAARARWREILRAM